MPRLFEVRRGQMQDYVVKRPDVLVSGCVNQVLADLACGKGSLLE